MDLIVRSPEFVADRLRWHDPFTRKFLDIVPPFKVIDQILDRDPNSSEHGYNFGGCRVVRPKVSDQEVRSRSRGGDGATGWVETGTRFLALRHKRVGSNRPMLITASWLSQNNTSQKNALSMKP